MSMLLIHCRWALACDGYDGDRIVDVSVCARVMSSVLPPLFRGLTDRTGHCGVRITTVTVRLCVQTACDFSDDIEKPR